MLDDQGMPSNSFYDTEPLHLNNTEFNFYRRKRVEGLPARNVRLEKRRPLHAKIQVVVAEEPLKVRFRPEF